MLSLRRRGDEVVGTRYIASAGIKTLNLPLKTSNLSPNGAGWFHTARVISGIVQFYNEWIRIVTSRQMCESREWFHTVPYSP